MIRRTPRSTRPYTLLPDTTLFRSYFADELGTPGTVMTTFPTRRTGLKGRKGSNQFTVCTYSIPKGSLEWWIGHLNSHGIATGEAVTRFGHRYVGFHHPVFVIDSSVLRLFCYVCFFSFLFLFSPFFFQ